MSTSQAKQDCIARLNAAGITFAKLTAKTVGMLDMAGVSPIFVMIHGATLPANWKDAFNGLPKPSDGGYVPSIGKCCLNANGKPIVVC
jgi:hypothetical protein